MKTKIQLNGACSVKLTAGDPYSGEEITREFFIPTKGGYVREYTSNIYDTPQVCAGLSKYGNTLHCNDGQHLLETVRKEWRKENSQYDRR